MQLISDKEYAEFFSDAPLYSKVQFVDQIDRGNEINVFEFLEKRGYKDFCQNCKDYHSFRFIKKYGSQFILSTQLAESPFYTDKKLTESFDISSCCQICQSRKDLMLNFFTNDSISPGKPFPKVFVRKIGQYPPIERRPELDVYNYLDANDKALYSKALGNLSVGYGIGAYAYFR